MKELITFLLYCLSVTALLAQSRSETRLHILNASLTETTLRLELSGFDQTRVTTPQGDAVVVGIQEGTPLLKKGAPDVPKFSTALLIPNKGNMALEIIGSEYEDYENLAVAPSKGNLLRTVNPDEVPYSFGPAYERDAFFPEKLADLQTPFVFREARGQALWLYPVHYNPVKRTLRVYRSITLRIYYTGGNGKNEANGGPVFSESRAFQQLYRQLFVNAKLPAASRGGQQQPEKMLVIAADALLSELEPLVAWRRQMGIHTTVVPLSEIGSSESGAIYNFVRDYYNEHGITYLLLVGDEDAIEPEMRADGGLYSCDNCFGYLSGDDYFPEVMVGRLHARSPEELRIMVNRNLEYEQQPLIDSTNNWLATGIACASNEGLGIGDDGQADWQHANEWKTAHLADGFAQYWEFYDGSHGADSPTPGDVTADQNGNPTNGPIVDLMNSTGVSLFNYTGHGWEQGLVSGNFNTTAVGNLQNTGRYPILIAVACCAGNFTNGDCLGEVFQRAGDAATGEPWGGIAGFFSSDYQSWSPPMEGQDGMNQFLVDADGITLTPTTASMLAYGNAKMIAAYGPDGEIMAGFWNPFTEPATVPRTRTPLPLTALHTDSVAFETLSLSVACPVEGAQVSLFWENQTWAVATVENGVANLEFAPLNNVGNLLVTVTQFNYLPYQGHIAVKPATQPFVVSQKVVLNDTAGNNNQQADYGESAALDIQLQNIGLGTASAVSASLTTSSPWVTLNNSQVLVGDLANTSGASASFPLVLASDVPNGAKATFNLTVSYNDSLEYATSFTLTLFAPSLEVAGWSIDDAAQGNGNKRLESGETVRLYLTNRNTGGSASPNALGVLSSNSPYLSVSDPVAIDPLNAVSGEQIIYFLVSVAPNAPTSVVTELQYTLQAGPYTIAKTLAPLMINPIVETFESNNFATHPWSMAGNKPWTTVSTGAYAGQYCARSGTIPDNQRSTMEITLLVTEDGMVSFARRVSSELAYDYLRFYIDSIEMGAWSGEVPWGEVSFPVSAGQHTLTWTYRKDDYVADGADRAWVDEILLPPHQIVVGTADRPTQQPLGASVFPNPNQGVFTVRAELPREQLLSIQVMDMAGRLVKTLQEPIRSSRGQLSRQVDLSGIKPGVYLVRLQGEFDQAAVKVVVW